MNTYYAIASALTFFISLSVGFLVFLKNKKNSINRSYFLLSLSTAAWAGGIYFHAVVYDRTWCLFWGRFAHIGASFIPIFFFQFATSFLNIHEKYKIHLKVGYFLAVFFSVFAFHPWFFTSVSPKVSLRQWADPGSLYPLFAAFFAIFIIYAFYIMLKAYPTLSSYRKNQLKYIIIASASGFSGGSTTFLAVYGIKIYFVHPFALYLVSLYNVVIAYAILKYHLMDINIVIKKGTVYTYLSFLVLIPCMFLIILSQRFFFGEINYAFSSLIFVMFFLAAFIFSKMKHRAEGFIERTLFKDKYEYKETLNKLGEIIISFLDEKELFKKTSDVLVHALGLEKISFFLLDREKRSYTLRAFKNLDNRKIREFPEDDLFFKRLKENGKIVVKEELEQFMRNPKSKPMVERLNSMESEVCIPLISKSELIGIINLGKKRSGDMYSHEDLELLTNFANQAAIALENARLYEDMKKTQLLMRRTDRLAALGTLTAGIAHEIRNPLVTVKTFLQLLPERFEDEELRGNFLRLTTSEVERISSLVNGLLDFARPSKPRLKKTDVNEVLKKVVHLVIIEAKKKGIAINANFKDIPQAMLDEEQIKHVFLNIFINAIEAISTNGNISVTSKSTQKDGLGYVQVEITDTGKGIPKEILDHIFDPFFTTKEKGTGLGLSISHQIVQEHNGYIEIESKPGESTTFFVNLPYINK